MRIEYSPLTSFRYRFFVYHFFIILVVVVLGFYGPPTAKVIRRRDLGLKSHSKDFFFIMHMYLQI